MQGHGYGLLKNPEGFILDDAYGPLRAGAIERAKEWGAQVVRTSVANLEGWAIWDRLVARVGPPVDDGPRGPEFLDLVSNTSELRRSCAA